MSLSKKKKEAIAEEVKQLRKKNGNLQCADCPMRNTTYVNTNHCTFVCTDCSGILRKYGFRVKSIHAASFSPKEVDALREGGNKVVNGQYMSKFKKGKGYELPPLGDTKKIDDFINMKYVDKRWFGSSGKKSKKKKGKKKPETPPESSSDDDSSSDSDSSSEEPVVVQKKSKKKKGKKEKEKKSKKGKSRKNAVVEEPIDLFAPNPAPVPQQQASNDDDWAKFDNDDWDAFGTSAPAAQPAQTQQSNDFFNQPAAPTQPQQTNNFFNQPAAPTQPQQNWQQPQQQVPQQSKANSGISPNDPFFAAFQSKPQTQNPAQPQPAAAPKVSDPFAELMASSNQSSTSTPEKVAVTTGPGNPFGAAQPQQNAPNPFGGWGAPQQAAPQQAPQQYGMQQQQYGYPQQQQQYGYPQQQQYGYPQQQQQQQYRSPNQQQQQYGYQQGTQQQQYMQQNFANVNLQSGGTQPGAGANPWA